MSFTEIYETDEEKFIGVVVDENINPIRIVRILDNELSPALFAQAKQGFKDAPRYESKVPLGLEWSFIERECTLVATFTNRGGFIAHYGVPMSKHAKKMFSKKARMKYEREYGTS